MNWEFKLGAPIASQIGNYEGGKLYSEWYADKSQTINDSRLWSGVDTSLVTKYNETVRKYLEQFKAGDTIGVSVTFGDREMNTTIPMEYDAAKLTQSAAYLARQAIKLGGKPEEISFHFITMGAVKISDEIISPQPRYFPQLGAVEKDGITIPGTFQDLMGLSLINASAINTESDNNSRQKRVGGSTSNSSFKGAVVASVRSNNINDNPYLKLISGDSSKFLNPGVTIYKIEVDGNPIAIQTTADLDQAIKALNKSPNVQRAKIKIYYLNPSQTAANIDPNNPQTIELEFKK